MGAGDNTRQDRINSTEKQARFGFDGGTSGTVTEPQHTPSQLTWSWPGMVLIVKLLLYNYILLRKKKTQCIDLGRGV